MIHSTPIAISIANSTPSATRSRPKLGFELSILWLTIAFVLGLLVGQALFGELF